LLLRRIELMPEPDALRALRHQAARVAADKLDDREAAVDLYEQAFEDDPSDDGAADALRALYEKLERWEPLLRFVQRLVDMADEATERADLRLECARICIDILESPSEGIEHLSAVLEELPSHQGAVDLQCKMLEKEKRDDELADLLNKQISLAHDAGEQDKELSYRVRAAELYESRLNDPEKAIEGYLGVLATDSGFRPALEALARLYEQQDQPESAAKMTEKLLDGAGDQLATLALKARDLFVAVDDGEAASRVLENVLSEGSGVASADVGRLRESLRGLYRDRQAWDKLAELVRVEAEEASDEDERVVLYRRAAEIHSTQRDDHGAAAELLEKASALRPDDRDLLLSLCNEYTASGRGKKTIEALLRVVESYGGRRSKELADIHQRIAAAHLAEGDHNAALEELGAARKMDPGSVGTLFELGTLSLRMVESGEGDKGEHIKRAGDSFRSLLLQRLDDDSPVTKADVFYHLAQVAQAEGDGKKAKQMAERALSNDKGHEKSKELLAQLG
jgi:tetratricopeptide (TPR) repeat protein